MDKIERGVKSVSAFKDKTKSLAGQYFAIILFAIFALAALIYQFCDIQINDNQDITSSLLQTAIVFISTMCISYSFYSSGKLRGKKSESYKNARLRYSQIISQIEKANESKGLDEFCNAYRMEELEGYRHELLESVGVDFEKFNDFANKNSLTILKDKTLAFRQKRAVLKAVSAKPKKLTSSAILGNSKVGRRKNFVTISEEGKTSFDMIKKVVTWLIVSLLTTFYLFTASGHVDISAFANFMKLIVSYSMSAVTSWLSGITMVENQVIKNYNSRSDILTVYCERKNIVIRPEKQTQNTDENTAFFE